MTGEKKLLSHEQTMAFIKEAQSGSENAKEILFVKNEALVKSIVKRFLGRGVDYEDLMQIGNLGLLKAINGFDDSFGVRFSTYAVPMIAGDIKRFLRDDGMIKVSRSIKETAAKAYKIVDDIKREQGRDASLEEISNEMGMDMSEVVFIMDSACAPSSLYEPAFDSKDGKTLLLDIIEDKNDSDIIEKIMLKQLLSKLTAKERKLIMLRFFDDKTQSQIAEILGVSQVQVSRQLTKTIEKLKKAAGD